MFKSLFNLTSVKILIVSFDTLLLPLTLISFIISELAEIVIKNINGTYNLSANKGVNSLMEDYGYEKNYFRSKNLQPHHSSCPTSYS